MLKVAKSVYVQMFFSDMNTHKYYAYIHTRQVFHTMHKHVHIHAHAGFTEGVTMARTSMVAYDITTKTATETKDPMINWPSGIAGFAYVPLREFFSTKPPPVCISKIHVE
jgi:hypothetical protein